jgi:hypothetical protein
VDDAIGDDRERFAELITQHAYEDCGVVEFRMKKPIAIPYVATGFGDDSYPVFELRSGRRRIGIEMEFLPPGFKYEDTDDDALVFPPEKVECGHCGGTGKCYCLRKGAGTAAGCVRCDGSGMFDAPEDNSYYSGNILPHEEGRMGAVTDKDGRVTLRGLSRGWLYDLSISGPTVVSTRAQLVARPDKPKGVPGAGVWTREKGEPKLTRYGSEFTFVAVPCKPILGVVRDKSSGKPLAGVGLGREWTRDDEPHPWTTTDNEGRYKLIGLPPGVHTIKLQPPSNSPYLAAEFRVHADRPNIEAVTFDIQLERQRAVSGRVIDRKNSKPVQCWVEYRPLAKNPNLSEHPLLAAPQWRNHPPSAQTDAAGRFTLPSLAGPGVLLVRAESDYLPAVFQEADRVAGVADPIDPELIDCRPLLAWPREFHAYRLIDVHEGKDAEVEIALTPGGTRPLVIEFPDGKPHDTTVLGLKTLGQDHGAQYYPGKSAVIGLADGEARRLFVSTNDGHFAAATVVSARETGPVTVKLKPTGTITGRVADKDGKPIEGASFQTLFEDGSGRPGVYVHGGFIRRVATPAESKRRWRTKGYDDGIKLEYATSSEKSDETGRFRLTGVLPDETLT